MRNILIAPRKSFNSYFSKYRDSDIFNDLKCYSKEDLIKEAYYSYTDDALVYLIKNKHFEYALAKKYLQAVSVIKDYKGTNKKILELVDIQKELLKQNLLIHNEYLDYELSTANIDVAYYSNDDSQINKVLNGKKYNVLNLETPIELICSDFDTIDDELFFVFNKIAELISNGVNPNSISIFGLKDEDYLLINRLTNHYHLHLNGFDSYKLIDSSSVRYLISNFENENIVDDIKEKFSDDPNIDKILELFLKFKIDSLSTFEQKRLLIDVFKSKSSSKVIYKEAINVIDEPFVNKGDYLFIVNFLQGTFPSVIKDDGILDDKDNVELGLSSLEKLNFDNSSLFKNALSQDAHIFVSYSNRGKSGKTYPSPLKKDLNLVFKHNPVSQNLYSKFEANIQSAYHHDLKHDFLIDSPLYNAYRKILDISYRTYSNKYNKALHFISKQVQELSYSSIKEYYQCAYRFYLGHILEIDPEDFTSYPALVGQISHYILENMEKGSFDELYEKAIKEYGKDFDAKERFLLEIRKEHFRRGFDFIKEQESHINCPKPRREDRKLVVDINPYLRIRGRIDKYITFGNNDEYVIVVDYKSGHEEFVESLIPYGLSLQLPIYGLLIKGTKELGDKQIAGLFIQKTYNKHANQIDVNNVKYYDELKLRGVFLDQVKVIENLDDSIYETNKSKYIASCQIKQIAPNEFVFGRNGSRARSEDWFNTQIETAKKLAISANENILDNKFDINPKIIKGNDKSCIHCPFRDICFRTNDDFVFISNGEGEEDE